MTAVLEIEGLTRRFGTVVANDDVSLRVRPGEVVGLLGHNGAGKTTLVSQVVGLLRPDAGRITVGGVDAVARPAAARRMVALQPQAHVPIDGLTLTAAVKVAARLRGLDAGQAGEAARRLVAELGLGAWADRRALPEGRGLSGGVRRLAGFAMAVVGGAPLVILDEPSNDVDAVRRRALWATVRRVADQGSGVLLVTHNVVEAERVVDELVVLDAGRVVIAGTPARLRGDDGLRLELHLVPDGPDPSDPGTATAGGPPVPVPVRRRVRSGRRVLLTVPPDAAAAAVSWAASHREQGTLDGYALTPATLEDAYLAATSDPARETEGVTGGA
ncbi:ABC transporter ATP-binding protein [Actinomadura algeriensis]|uniref:ABC-2 type transport system ATP-binding protein n=1 Tax=Actinomadura algeriensis TaxID=1679523 RepID=A0ABR9JJK2_9ACTN|nr:ABC transporter ATP-binding protein [Actinomadura algeriensis]MBE1530325.1 ABC-2 type transport system ATP-binding protein [Actinomadura algeriensis]